MTQKEKKQIRYYLAMSNPVIKDAVESGKDFFILNMKTLRILDDYAEIFCIKNNEISRARKLWNELLETHDKVPF